MAKSHDCSSPPRILTRGISLLAFFAIVFASFFALADVTYTNNNIPSGNITENVTFNISTSSSPTYSGIISDSGSTVSNVTKTGTGTLTFSGANTYTGSTTISAGKLYLKGNGTLGNGTSTISIMSSDTNKWPTLIFSQESGTVNFNHNVKSNWYTDCVSSGKYTGRIWQDGAATLNFSGSIDGTGFMSNAGVTNFGTAESPNANKIRVGVLYVRGGSTVNYYGTNDNSSVMTICAGGYSFVGYDTGNGTLNINGKVKTETSNDAASHLVLYIGSNKEENPYQGTVNLNSGSTYTAGKQKIYVASWGDGYLNIHNGAELNSESSIILTEHSGGNGTITIDQGGKLTTSGELTIAHWGKGTVEVSGELSSTNNIVIGYQGNAAANSGGLLLVKEGGVVETTGDIIVGNKAKAELTIDGGTVTANAIDMKGQRDFGGGAIEIKNGGFLTVDSIGFGNVESTTYAVDTTLTLNDGTLTVAALTSPGDSNNNNVIPSVNLGKGTVITGASDTSSVWDDPIPVNLTYADGTNIQVDADKTATIDGLVSGSGALVKKGAGTLTLSQAPQYTGSTTIESGTLALSAGGTLYNLSGGSESNPVTLDAGTNNLTINNLTADDVKRFIGSITANTITVNATDDEAFQIYTAANGLVSADSFIVSSGRVDVKGCMEAAVKVGSDATFSPGNSVGHVETTEDFTLDGTLLIEVDGSGADTLTCDTFTINGGTVVLDWQNDEIPFFATCDIITSTSDLSDVYDNLLGNLDFSTSPTVQQLYEDGYITLTLTGSNNNIITMSIDRNAVPEPSTWALLALGVVVLFLRKRVRN